MRSYCVKDGQLISHLVNCLVDLSTGFLLQVGHVKETDFKVIFPFVSQVILTTLSHFVMKVVCKQNITTSTDPFILRDDFQIKKVPLQIPTRRRLIL